MLLGNGVESGGLVILVDSGTNGEGVVAEEILFVSKLAFELEFSNARLKGVAFDVWGILALVPA